jgi:C-terminal processing protease CtpA/Prc
MDLLLKKPALEIKCTIERVLDVGISADRTLLTSSGDLIGAVFSMEFDGLTVAEVREGGPSFAAGLGEGDLVTALDGKPTRYMPLQKAVEFIRESKGTKVSVTVRRETILWRIERTR